MEVHLPSLSSHAPLSAKQRLGPDWAYKHISASITPVLCRETALGVPRSFPVPQQEASLRLTLSRPNPSPFLISQRLRQEQPE